MTEARWARVAELFERAVALPAGERAAFLEAECGADQALLATVRALLEADERPPSVLDATPTELAALAESATPVAEGWRVGPYRLRAELGRGGMGVVYLADRDDLQTSVALKLLLPGPATAAHSARVKREQLVHAQLEHPHIARLLDAGLADDGTPWIAMEYVEGLAIDQHSDTYRLSIDARLALFEKVGEAVSYAHQCLVVHRDIKPSNILVTSAGEPKLVDFGIAKPLWPEASGLATATHPGGMALTLAYASPEQLRAEPVTTATDVYQLGLLLHELLTGVPASLTPGRLLSPAARLAGQEAVRPSLLAQDGPGRKAGTDLPPAAVRAGRRGSTPERLRRTLEGDLDVIVQKALRPEPAERYATAQQLVEDVRRYREGLPVLARPGSLAYRVGKAVRRHRIASVLLGLLLVAVVGGTLTLGLQARRVARERDRADQFSQLLEGLIYGADPLGAGDSITARTVLDRTAEQARAGVAVEPLVWGRMLVVVGKAYQNLGHSAEAITAQRQAVAAFDASGQANTPLALEALRSLGITLARTGETAAGVAWVEEAVRRAHQLGAGRDAELGRSLADLGRVRNYLGDLDSAVVLMREGLALLSRIPDSGGADFDRLRVDLGNVLLQGSQLAEAEALMRGAVARLSAKGGQESGAALSAKGELGDVLLKRGKIEEATRIAAEVLATRRRVNSGPHQQVAVALLYHGRALAEAGRMEEAARDLREALALWVELGGEESSDAAYARVQLADALKRGGQALEARALEERALAFYLERTGPASDGAAYTSTRLARSEHLLGDLDGAERRFREALPRLDSSPSGQGRLVRPLSDFAELLAQRGKCAEALPYLRRVIGIAEGGWGPAHPAALRPRRLLGECLRQERRYEAAEVALLEGWKHAAASGDYEPRMRAELATALVALYDAWGRSARAEPFRVAARTASIQ